MSDPRKIIIDCDPGQDDALMLLLAFASPEALDIKGIVAVAGNVALDKTQRNARILCDLADRKDMRVFAGEAQPLVRNLELADHVHGREGINGVEIFEPETPLQSQAGVDFIIDTLRASDADITLVPTGPLTNIAQVIKRAPEVVPKIREIVLMGGAMREGGNITPSAEYNIYVDPHAAEVVFRCCRPIVAMGLDVTHQVCTSPAVLQKISAMSSRAAKAAYALLTEYEFFDAEKYGSIGAPLHDPCTIAYLLDPEIFKLKECNIEIETSSPLTMGHTAVDFWYATDRAHNARWAYQADRERFFDLMIDRLARYGSEGV